jgi:hypothetical protein
VLAKFKRLGVRRMTMGLSDPGKRRMLNDDRWRLFERLDSPIAFICECIDPDCFATVILSGEEFGAARATPPYLLLKPGHIAAVQVGMRHR